MMSKTGNLMVWHRWQKSTKQAEQFVVFAVKEMWQLWQEILNNKIWCWFTHDTGLWKPNMWNLGVSKRTAGPFMDVDFSKKMGTEFMRKMPWKKTFLWFPHALLCRLSTWLSISNNWNHKCKFWRPCQSLQPVTQSEIAHGGSAKKRRSVQEETDWSILSFYLFGAGAEIPHQKLPTDRRRRR